MLKISSKNPNFSIAINRGQRKEPLWFKLFYELCGLLIMIFSFKKIRFGNYSLINFNHIKKLITKVTFGALFHLLYLKL